jgi:hypothetical protein
MSLTSRRLLSALAAVLLSTATLVVSAGPAQAGLTGRRCTSRTAGAYRLDFCVRGWVDAGNDHTRGVVEMHTYRYIPGGPNGGWVDSTSQSITLNFAAIANPNEYGLPYSWGNTGAETGCRVNGPAGRVGCSVPNTARVAFYSKDNASDGRTWTARVHDVSFRDAQGVAHRFVSDAPVLEASWAS